MDGTRLFVFPDCRDEKEKDELVSIDAPADNALLLWLLEGFKVALSELLPLSESGRC
jgi:hypothetical protein